MGSLAYTNRRADPAAWARELGISREAVELYLASDVIDLHVDSFIWHRTWGIDIRKRHGKGLFGARFYGHVDFPRVREACITGATWVITTNPLRNGEERARHFVENLSNLRALIEDVPDEMELVTTAAEYRRAKAAGRHGAFIGIQGGNALDRDLEALDLLPPGVVLRITLVHLSASRIGRSSAPTDGAVGKVAPWSGDKPAGDVEGLSDFGRDYVRRLNEKNVFVDLAHISRRGFWDAVAVHDKSKPFIVTHTGVEGVFPHWRNLDDAQFRAVADSGGTVGIMYHGEFLGGSQWTWPARLIVDHIEHVVKTVGEDFVSLGSDWDGAIITPRDMPTCLELPVLVDMMLRRGFSPTRVQKVLGGNFLRTLEALRG